MNAQDPANNIFVDVDAESQRDLLSNAGTAPAGIEPFHCYNGVNEVFLRSLRTRTVPALGRKQQALLSFPQHTVEMEQSVVGRMCGYGTVIAGDLEIPFVPDPDRVCSLAG